MASKSVGDVDFYELLGVELGADVAEIRKAYRKKALECHPDKNPDNPKAAELFHELSKALEILADTSARTAYDKVLNAKKAAKLRHREIDSKRRKLIEDLEERERIASLKAKKYKTFDERTDEEKLLAEIERLQKEGSKLLQEEQERLAKEITAEKAWNSTENRVKIKWIASKSDKTNGGYNEEVLREILKKYGDIKELVVSKTKNGSALIEFTTREASELAVEIEKGFCENPLTLKWLKGSPSTGTTNNSNGSNSGLITERDYESLILTKLRQQGERQKLIEQMMKEDTED